MRCLLFVAIVLAMLAIAVQAVPKWDQLNEYSFDKYCEEFSREYQGTEYMTRRAIFERNLENAKTHNADNTKTWKQGVNRFSDWTAEERKAYNKAHTTPELVDKMPTFESNPIAAAPATLDYRQWSNPRVLSAIKDQGACGGCWGFSAVETVESRIALLTNQIPVLAAQQVISCTEFGMLGCGGGSFFYGWIGLSQGKGLYEEWVYPFVNFFAKGETKAATQACQDMEKKQLPNFKWGPQAGVISPVQVTTNNATALIDALAQKGPQSIVVSAEPWMSYEGGIFQNSPGPNEWAMDHAVQAVGYGHDEKLNMDYWIVRNSWGTQWGENGFIRLARPADEPCGSDQGQKVCGTSGILFQPGYPEVKSLKTHA